MNAPNLLLNVNGIEVIYNHVALVLKGVSLQVPEGRIVAILGGNGAGKTTTLRAISWPRASRITTTTEYSQASPVAGWRIVPSTCSGTCAGVAGRASES